MNDNKKDEKLEQYVPLEQAELFESIKENVLMGMANFWPKDTGLPFEIWITPKSGREGHWARIKVHYADNMVPVTIGDEPEWKSIKIKRPKEWNQIKKFIIKNKKLLLKYWNKEISTTDLVHQMQKI